MKYDVAQIHNLCIMCDIYRTTTLQGKDMHMKFCENTEFQFR